MAAKLLHSLADDNPDLQKQIGCMTGIFQVFDRHHILSGRRFSGQGHKRLLPPGASQFYNGSLDADSTGSYNRETMERSSNRYANEKRGSTESSRASFSSSSRSSSFSSLDCGKTGQQEASALDRITFPETPSRDPVMAHPSTSPKLGRHSLDLRDVVKDSMYRESRGLSVQTGMESTGPALRQRDSPRPMQLSKSVDGSLGVTKNGKHEFPADLKESLRVLAKLREAPWYYSEKEMSRLLHETKDGRISRDAPRFSCDGREVNHTLESRDTFRSSQKIKDLPRLSLDSREIAARGASYDSRLMHLSRDAQMLNNEFDDRGFGEQQASAVQTRPASVVAKLMGLEALPDTAPSSTIQLDPIRRFSLEDHRLSSVPIKTSDVCRPIQLPSSPRSIRRDPNSPRWRNTDGVMKPVSSSKFPLEPAPWKHLNDSRGSPKQSSKQTTKSPSVYSEIEKRLKDLEFKQSGKDLRALKQILEAMQAKGLLDRTKEQISNVGSGRVDDRRYRASDVPGLTSSQNVRRNRAAASTFRGNGPTRTSESPIVIMKPAKLVQKAGIPSSSVVTLDDLTGVHRSNGGDVAVKGNPLVNKRAARDENPKDNHRDRAASSTDKKTSTRNIRGATSTRPQSPAKDNTTSSIKSSTSTSPRLQQRKMELERKSRPPTPSDSNKPRRQSNRLSSESTSPGGKRRPKSLHLQQHDERLVANSNESRSLHCEGDDISVQSDSKETLECKPVSTDCQSPAADASKRLISGEMQKPSRREDDQPDGPASLTPIRPIPSPISVLDSSAYREDSPSPVKQASHALQDGEIINSDKIHGETQCDPTMPTSEMSRQKLQSIDNLVQKLRRLNSTHDETRTDYIASLCENTNLDHRYISEILLASGLLLRDLTSGLTAFQLHPSGHPINPELFFVLEQTKASSLLLKQDKSTRTKPDLEKLNRKLIFDTVNEILTVKLASICPPPEPWLSADKLARKTLSAQKLLRELCAEIEQLQPKKVECSLLEDEDDGLRDVLWEDVMQRSDNWTDFRGEMSGIVLDIERSIFKDLVDEVVMGEAVAMRSKRSKHCRQLF